MGRASIGADASSCRVHVFARARPVDPLDGACPTVADEASSSVRIYSEVEQAQRLERQRTISHGSLFEGAAVDGDAGSAVLEKVSNIDSRAFAFDSVFAEQASQGEVFEKVGLPVLRECLKGFNGTILAYGQTGSGKTHSLLHQGQNSDEAGLLPRLVACLFAHAAQDISHVYEIEAAAVQVYNEQVDDLLHPDHANGGGHGLLVQNAGSVPGLTWAKCDRPEVLLSSFNHARTNIVYAETKMNKASSRSHAVFQMKITKRKRATEGEDGQVEGGPVQQMECTRARLNVVDLAGSERVKKSGVEGMQLKEASAINRSLLAFGNVVSALAAKQKYVPFRDSKLTRILDGSIGGNTKTSLLVCFSPAAQNTPETLSALEFASRAMRVEVDAKVNVGVVEVSANALLGDLKCSFDNLLSMSHQAELEELRRASAEQLERAEREVQRQEAIIAVSFQTSEQKLKELRGSSDEDIAALRQALEQAGAREAELLADACANRKSIESLEAAQVQRQEEAASYQANLEELKTEHAREVSTREQAEAAVTQASEEIQSLTQQVAELQHKQQTSQTAAAESQANIETAKDEQLERIHALHAKTVAMMESESSTAAESAAQEMSELQATHADELRNVRAECAKSNEVTARVQAEVERLQTSASESEAHSSAELLRLQDEISMLRSTLQQKEALAERKGREANESMAKAMSELQATHADALRKVGAECAKANESTALLQAEVERLQTGASEDEAHLSAELLHLQDEISTLRFTLAQKETLAEKRGKEANGAMAKVQEVQAQIEKLLPALEEVSKLQLALQEHKALVLEKSSVAEKATAELHKLQLEVATSHSAHAKELQEAQEQANVAEQAHSQKDLEAMEARALHAERESRSAALRVVALENAAAHISCERDVAQAQATDTKSFQDTNTIMLMEEEVMKTAKQIQQLKAEASQARLERDVAKEEAQAAEVRFEEEIEMLQEEVEASCERDAEVEAAERRLHSEALSASKAAAKEWENHAVTLEAEIRQLKAQGDAARRVKANSKCRSSGSRLSASHLAGA